MNNRLFLGLVHYPVYNKNRQVIATSVTNLDIHDIARCVATYGVKKYYIIHPLATQHMLVREIIAYWRTGFGASYNPDRKEAFNSVALAESIEEAKAEIVKMYKGQLFTVVTDARSYPGSLSYRTFRDEIDTSAGKNYLLLFGTGWGLSQEVIESADFILQPVYGSGDYNHLSVRSAAAIILDRILGEKWW